ncbi:MAG: phage tail sheath C-terminal domain-containing protein [Hymenobacter sp.]
MWGARTLAGNDNEWRYVNVRRLFLFVRESVQKGIESFVSEPNDANTWVRVQAMVENFLTLLWRQGALQGAKSAQAFYVAVGLGKTTRRPPTSWRVTWWLKWAWRAMRPAEFTIIRLTQRQAAS